MGLKRLAQADLRGIPIGAQGVVEIKVNGADLGEVGGRTGWVSHSLDYG
jgi:hypothetical protein